MYVSMKISERKMTTLRNERNGDKDTHQEKMKQKESCPNDICDGTFFLMHLSMRWLFSSALLSISFSNLKLYVAYPIRISYNILDETTKTEKKEAMTTSIRHILNGIFIFMIDNDW